MLLEGSHSFPFSFPGARGLYRISSPSACTGPCISLLALPLSSQTISSVIPVPQVKPLSPQGLPHPSLLPHSPADGCQGRLPPQFPPTPFPPPPAAEEAPLRHFPLVPLPVFLEGESGVNGILRNGPQVPHLWGFRHMVHF